MVSRKEVDPRKAPVARVIPLLASPQGGVAASSRKCRAATEADAAGVVFLLHPSENHPGLAISGASRYFLDRSATPPCGDGRRHLRLRVKLRINRLSTGFPESNASSFWTQVGIPS